MQQQKTNKKTLLKVLIQLNVLGYDVELNFTNYKRSIDIHNARFYAYPLTYERIIVSGLVQ